MALKYLSNIDLNGNQLRGASIEPLSSAPSDHLVAGRVYFDTSENVLYSHTGSAWVQVGTTYTTSIVSDSGIKLRLTGNDSTSDDILFAGGTGLTTVRTDASTITLNLDDTAVTAATYGSATAIPEIVVDAQGRITGVTNRNISTELTVDGDTGSASTSLAADDLQFLGTSNEITTAVTKVGTDVKVTIGLPTNVTIAGDLTVTGKTVTTNVETVSTSNGVVFEGNAANDHEVTLKATTVTADRNIILPDASGTVQLVDTSTFAANIGDGSATSVAITHNLGTRDVIVQIYDNSSYDTVIADVVRTSTSVVTVSFAAAPTSNDIRVLITKIG